MKIRPFFLFLVIFFSYGESGRCQININSCGVNLTINSFKQDSAFQEENEVLIKKNVLKPITKVESEIEMRLYYKSYGKPGPVTVIKCANGTISATKYEYFYSRILNPVQPIAGFINIGGLPEQPGAEIFMRKSQNIKLDDITWPQFFSRLNQLNFFSCPQQQEIISLVSKANPNIQIRGENEIYIQVKMGKYFRNMKYSILYDEHALGVKEYNELMQIYQILNKIK